MKKNIWTLVIVCLPFFVHAEKKEIIGKLSLSDVLIQPEYNTTEGGKSKFEVDSSFFFFSWNIQENFSTHFGVGEKSLVNTNYRLSGNNSTTVNENDLTFFEAYGEYDTQYGSFRAGIIPLLFGYEGDHRESEWMFPSTLFFNSTVTSGRLMRDFGFRDYGASYHIDWRNFYTAMIIHNGENGKDQDGKMWYTAKWGWRNKKNLEFSLSASAGNYLALGSTEEFEYQYFNFYWQYSFWKMQVLLEGLFGEEGKEKDSSFSNEYWNVHLDLQKKFGDYISGLFRYELYEPTSRVADNKVNRYVLGLGFHNQLKTSNVFIWGIQNKEEGRRINNDEIQIVWKIRSLSLF